MLSGDTTTVAYDICVLSAATDHTCLVEQRRSASLRRRPCIQVLYMCVSMCEFDAASKLSQYHLETRVSIVAVSRILVILALGLVPIGFGAVENVEQNACFQLA